MNTSNGSNAEQGTPVSHGNPVKHNNPAPSIESPQRCRTTGTECVDGSQLNNTTAPPLTVGASQAYTSYETDSRRKGPVRNGTKTYHMRQKSSTSSRCSSTPSKIRRTNPLTEMDIQHHLCELLDQLPGSPAEDLVDAYTKASSHPPVTYESLSELDITRIVNNPKLRHDVNFDRELHFRPNLDGSRGKHKLRASEQYWNALIGELELYRAVGAQLITCNTPHEQAYWTRMMGVSQKRMPGMFETIRDVLKTLVPERDQPTVAERLDVAMIMQEISKGVFDLMSLAQWLAKLLKAHCAPMRDDWIDQMVAQTQRGVNEGCQRRIVFGLRQLLGILEAMKLVGANTEFKDHMLMIT